MFLEKKLLREMQLIILQPINLILENVGLL